MASVECSGQCYTFPLYLGMLPDSPQPDKEGCCAPVLGSSQGISESSQTCLVSFQILPNLFEDKFTKTTTMLEPS